MKFFDFLVLAGLSVVTYGAPNRLETKSSLRKEIIRQALRSRATQICMLNQVLGAPTTLGPETTTTSIQYTDDDYDGGDDDFDEGDDVYDEGDDYDGGDDDYDGDDDWKSMRSWEEGNIYQQCALEGFQFVSNHPPTHEERNIMSNFLRNQYKKMLTGKKPLQDVIAEYRSDVTSFLS